MSKNYKFETLQLHVGQENADSATDSRAVPIYATTSYVFKDSAQAAGRFALTEPGNIYTRLMNPTSDVFEKRVAALEGGIGALATASGSAAIAYAIQNIAKAGDHIVSSTTVYGGTSNLFDNTLPEQRNHDYLCGRTYPKNFEEAIQDNTKAALCRDSWKPEFRYDRSRGYLRNRPPSRHSVDCRQHLCHPISAPSARARCGYRGTFRNQVHRRPWNRNGRCHCGRRHALTGHRTINSRDQEPNPSYHGIVFTSRAGMSPTS